MLTASRGQHKKIQRELKRKSSEPVIKFKARYRGKNVQAKIKITRI